MQQAKVRKFLVLIFLLGIAGQAVAASQMACAFMDPGQDSGQMQFMDTVDHSKHFALEGDAQEDSACCPDCECAAGSCSSLIIGNPQQPVEPAYHSQTYGYSDKTPNQIQTSLFRPPITA